MALKTGQQYRESLQKQKPTVYILGEKVENPWEHPLVKPSVNSVALTYDLAADPSYAETTTAHSTLIGDRINRFSHLWENRDDLVKKLRMLRVLGQKTATCFQRCTCMEGINPLHLITYEIDKQRGTKYHQRFLDFVKHIQKEDLITGVAMTDVKGDRSLRPSQQADPDLFLHVVEERRSGIVVRGAKAHQTGAINCHWTIALPTRTMREEDKDYAICFATPVDAKNLIHIYSRQSADLRKMEPGDIDKGNAMYDSQTTLLIFDNVFVPWEMVFMYREWEFCDRLANIFGSQHRHSYGACKSGVIDVLIGATALMAEYHGIDSASHVRSKLGEMIQMNETMWGCSLASAYEAQQQPSGIWMNDFLLGNVCKLNAGRHVYQIAQIAADITGGILATLPSEKDYRNPDIGHYMEKYLKGVASAPTEHKLRTIRLIENLVMGSNSNSLLVETVHGAGSPEAQKAMLIRLGNLDAKKELARVIAGISK